MTFLQILLSDNDVVKVAADKHIISGSFDKHLNLETRSII